MKPATELEFLKYLYDHMNIEDLWELEEGFKADMGKDLPVGYTPTTEGDVEDMASFWEQEEQLEDCGSCPHKDGCNRKNEDD